MIDIGIYRAGFIVTLIALAVVAFAMQNRPVALTTPIPPDVFDAGEAIATTREIADKFPDRKTGSNGDQALGDMVRQRFEQLGLKTSIDSFAADDKDMLNVLGVVTGRLDRQIVLLAHRDARRSPGAASASNTAALIEMARSLDSASHDRTFVLVSTDGGTSDYAGARHFARHYPDRSKVDAIFVLDDIAAAKPRRPYLIPWSSGSDRGSLQILRTASAALERELGTGPGYQSWAAQFLRQAWPITLREQGPLVEQRINALTFSASGEVPRRPSSDTLTGISEERMSQFGRAILASALAYDSASKLTGSPRRYVVAARKVMPGWAIALLGAGLLVPAVIAAIDAFARARRQREEVGAWVRWVLSAAVPFAVTLAATWVFQLAGWLPPSPAAAISPLSKPGFGDSAPALAALALLFAIAWLVLRPIVLARNRRLEGSRPATPAVALSLVLAVEVLLVWAANPFAALLLVPAVHLCLVAALPESPSRALLVVGMVIGALALPLLALVYYGGQFHLGWHVGNYLLMLVTSATSSVATGVLCSLIAGSLVATVLIALGADPDHEPDNVTVRGPVSYAGPGSLGGTSSTLRP